MPVKSKSIGTEALISIFQFPDDLNPANPFECIVLMY